MKEIKYSVPDALLLHDFEEIKNEGFNEHVERINTNNFQSHISNNLYYNIVKNEHNKILKKQKTRKNRKV